MPKSKLHQVAYELLNQKYIIEGKSSRVVAKELGLGKSSIHRYLRAVGIEPRPQKASRIGKKQSAETRAKISKNHARICGPAHYLYGVRRFGADNYSWRGGTTELTHRIRGLKQYTEWRKQVFERDKYTCVHCGDNRGGNLEADHIEPLCILIKQYNIKTTEDAIIVSALWDINNGRTLCEDCHKRTDTWGAKAVLYKRAA